MSCNITKGRAEPCKQFVGGISAIYFINWNSSDVITKDVDGTITTIDDGATTPELVNAYEYEVRMASSFVENIQSSRETGTTVFEQVVEGTFKGMSQAENDELRLLAWGRPRIIVTDNNGVSWLVGEKFGAELTGGTIARGNAMSDLYGATATFTGMEPLQATQIADLATAVTIVKPVVTP